MAIQDPITTNPDPSQAIETLQARLDNVNTDKPNSEDPPPWKPNGWRFWAIFPGLCFSSLLIGLDSSILTTSLPTIIADLEGGSLYVWTMNGYFLTTAITQPFSGQCADIFGRRYPMILALVLFGVGSGLCGGASSVEMLIGARLVQGVGAGMIMTMSDIIAADLVPLRERMKYVGIVMIFFTLGSFLGPIVGGAIIQTTSWRWVFYINLPIVSVALLFVILFLHVEHKREGTLWSQIRRIDFLGNFILTSAVVAMLIPLTWGGTTYAWSSWRILVPLIIGFLGLILFGLHQAYVTRQPLMPLRLYRTWSTRLGYTLTFLHGLILSWLSLFLPVYFQVLLEATPLISGVSMLGVLLPFAPSGILGGVIVAVTGRYKPVILAGFGFLSVGVGCLTLLDSRSSTGVWIVLQIIVGIGAGLALTATLPAVQAPLPESDVAVATAAWAFMRSFGAIWGASIPAAVFNSRFDSLRFQINNTGIQDMLKEGGAYEHATRAFMRSLNTDRVLKNQVTDVYTECLKRVWMVLIAFTVVCVPLGLFIRETVLRKVLETEFGLRVDGSRVGGDEAAVGEEGEEMKVRDGKVRAGVDVEESDPARVEPVRQGDVASVMVKSI